MLSRSKRMLQMVTSHDKNLLDLPKFESTKGTSHKEQVAAILTMRDEIFEYNEGRDQESKVPEERRAPNDQEIGNKKIEDKCPLNKEQGVDHEQIREEVENKGQKGKKEDEYKNENDGKLDQVHNQQYDRDTSDELFLCSESEYVPDTTSDSETDGQDVEHPFKGIYSQVSSPKHSTTFKNKIIDLPSTSGKNNEFARGNGIGTNGNVDETIVAFGTFLASTCKVEHFTNSRPWTKRNTCPYCFREVTHFSRHLQRNHESEGAVKEFLSMTLKNPKRKQLIDVIRRQGNFNSNSKINIIRPIRRPRGQHNNEIVANSENSKDKYIVCQNCLGYFRRNYLRRHRKKCAMRPERSAPGVREQHLSAAQLFAVCSGSHNDFYATLRLKDEVFPIMRNDNISKTAMGDILICNYAESLLRKHKRPQIRNVISNKMRELGRLLMVITNVTGVQGLFGALRPEMFDNFVSATKIISGYDVETRTFKASSLALHMATTLKQVCDVATKLIIKKCNLLPCVDQSQSLKDIKRLKNLIENHWNSELSSLALKNLNENKYDKPKLLPLTSDVVKFQQCVMKEAKEARNNLRQGSRTQAEYRRLSECVLALTLLLNRKRIGEIQYLTVKTYNNTTSQTQQEEFLRALSESERTLTKSFKRVVTVGKGSKPVPILFAKDMQEFIDVLLEVRNLYVPEKNEYLFANPATENRWLSGYHTLKKLAERSGVDDKTLFTSTRLRKQIATILQVLNVTENEMEQFANFMGHTKKTHENYYRLPQDIYQTAKVSKLLLAINSGKGHLYKGKTLEEIEMSDNLDVDSESDSNEITSHIKPDTSVKSPGVSTFQQQSPDQNTVEQMEKPRIKRIPWTEKQKQVIRSFFKHHIKNKRAPKKHEIEKLTCQHPNLFKDKKWDKIKAYVYNCYK